MDAPVSGGPSAAQHGSLAIMAGGGEADFARVRPVLDTLGANVVRVGEAGAGHAMKAVNQLIVGQCIETVAEAMALAHGLGFSPQLVQQALRGGSADNPQLRVQGTRMGRREYEPGGRVRTVLKDLRLAAALADELSLSLPGLLATLGSTRAPSRPAPERRTARCSTSSRPAADVCAGTRPNARDAWLRTASPAATPVAAGPPRGHAQHGVAIAVGQWSRAALARAPAASSPARSPSMSSVRNARWPWNGSTRRYSGAGHRLIETARW